MTKTVLIAGASGFLGINLAKRLLQQGWMVVGVDDFSTGQRAHVKELSAWSTFIFIEQSINQPLTNLPPLDFIINLACPASPPFYQQLSLHTLASCSIGVLNLLQLAAAHQAILLHASTSEIYGQPQVFPQPESYWGHVNPIGVRSCYDEGKRFAESLITNFAKQQQVDARIMRIFNTYGPGMRLDDGRVVSNFISQALQGKPLTIFGSGLQTRSLCFVDDLIDGMIKLLLLEPQKYPGPINLGNPEEITILALAKTISELCQVPLKTVSMPLPSDDPERRCPDITLIKQLLGWSPQISLAVGLERCIQAFKRELKIT